MVGRDGYTIEAVAAAHSVILEVAHILGEYRKHAVVVGGWIPTLLIPSPGDPHIGSIDVDLVLNTTRIGAARYKSLLKTLADAGYVLSKDEAEFRFRRQVNVPGVGSVSVPLDLLAGEYGGRGKRHRTQRVQDGLARKARGADLAFDNPSQVRIQGALPDGRNDAATIQVAGPLAWLCMKGMALAGRLKAKDAYDIAWFVSHWPAGIADLADGLRGQIAHGLAREGLGKIRSKFARPDDFGPVSVSVFLKETEAEAKHVIERRAFEAVDEFLSCLDVPPWTGL